MYIRQFVTDLGLTIVEDSRDSNNDYDYSTRGWIVIKHPFKDGKFIKVELYDDSYGSGEVEGWRNVKPRQVAKTEYY